MWGTLSLEAERLRRLPSSSAHNMCPNEGLLWMSNTRSSNATSLWVFPTGLSLYTALYNVTAKWLKFCMTKHSLECPSYKLLRNTRTFIWSNDIHKYSMMKLWFHDRYNITFISAMVWYNLQIKQAWFYIRHLCKTKEIYSCLPAATALQYSQIPNASRFPQWGDGRWRGGSLQIAAVYHYRLVMTVPSSSAPQQCVHLLMRQLNIEWPLC